MGFSLKKTAKKVKHSAEKTYKEVKHAGENLYHSAEGAITDTYHAVGDVFDITGQALQGDISGVGRELSDLAKHTTGAVVGYSETVSGVGAISGGAYSNMAGNLAGAGTAYATGNFARGSNYLEAATGSDIFGRQAKREAKAEAEAAAAEAKRAATAERAAQLRKTRRQILPTTRGMTGYAGGGDDENYAGLLLG